MRNKEKEWEFLCRRVNFYDFFSFSLSLSRARALFVIIVIIVFIGIFHCFKSNKKRNSNKHQFSFCHELKYSIGYFNTRRIVLWNRILCTWRSLRISDHRYSRSLFVSTITTVAPSHFSQSHLLLSLFRSLLFTYRIFEYTLSTVQYPHFLFFFRSSSVLRGHS